MEMSELKTMHCPHNWGFNNFHDIEEHLLKIDKGYMEEDDDVGSTEYGEQCGKFIRFCLLSFEAYRKKKYNEALKYLATADVTDDFMDKYSRVFQHVIKASRAHILYAMNLLKDAKKIAVEMNNEIFSEAEKAAFKFVQCCMHIKYGEYSPDVCVNLIKSALDVVNNEPEFYFLYGNVLSRIRHFKYPYPPPSSEEFDVLRQAVLLKKNKPKYCVALARLYVDSKNSVPLAKRKSYIGNAVRIYRNLLNYHESLGGNDIARCVFNLTKLSFDPDLEEYAKMAQKKSDSTLMNHYVGSFYLRNKQYEEAYACFDKACNVLPFLTGPVLLTMYRMNGDSISNTEIEPRIKQWTCLYESSQDERHLIHFFLVMSEFCLIVMDDLKSASLYFLNAAKYGITERNFITLSVRYSYINYLLVLKNQIFSSKQNDETILEAKHVIETLKKEVITEMSYKTNTPTVTDIRNYLN